MGLIKNCEIVGGGFVNKGAELMLLCCLDAFSNEPGFRLSMNWKQGNYQQRARTGLLQKVDFPSLGNFSSLPLKFLPKKVGERLGVVSEYETDFVLDISGFAYSDQWGTGGCEVISKRAARRHKQGERYILLPQAYGPFEKPEVRKLAKQYFDAAEVLFVRDKRSLGYMKDLMGEDDRLRLCPDFTCLIEPLSDFDAPIGDYICIVPNCRMIDKRHGGLEDTYLNFLSQVVRESRERNLKVILVNHEGEGDRLIIEDLQKAEGDCVEVRNLKDPRALKSLFRGSRFVVSSRYHAAISAMTQHVPVIGLGWSHKYRELFTDFELEEFLLEPQDAIDQLPLRIESILSAGPESDLSKSLVKGAALYKESAKSMWSDIFKLLKSN